MLRSTALHFPRLVWVKDVTFQRGDDKNKETPLYRLDWSAFDAEDMRDWENWKSKHWSKVKTLAWSCKLEEPYEGLLQNSLYALNRSYRDEMRRMCMMAVVEWNIERGFDTMIREMCLKPAIKFVECAFKLLTDCTYDEKTNYFSRNTATDIILPHILMYRFWQHQSGRGCIEGHSDFDRLWWLLKHWETASALTKGTKMIRTEETEMVTNFLEAMKRNRDTLDKCYSYPMPDVPVEGPSKDEPSVPAEAQEPVAPVEGKGNPG